jgi:hypothetical protein
MECNQLAEVQARAGPTSGVLAMASGNRKAVKLIGRRVRVSRLSGGSQQATNHGRWVNSGRRFGGNSRTVFTEAWETRGRKTAIGDNGFCLQAAIRAATLDSG